MKHRKILNSLAVLALLLFACAMPGRAQVKTEVPAVIPGAPHVFVQHIKIHGESLVGNLEGEAVNRDAIVFLPPSYYKDKHRHYPVLYALHGYSIGAEQWTHEIHVPQTIEGAYAKGARQMIVVLPDSKTVYGGSMYSRSQTTGDFEEFIAHDVVHYMDTHYRTTPPRLSRGLVGHSMGGYGALRIGMQYPNVFGVLYVMSACCLSQRPMSNPNSPMLKPFYAAVAKMKSPSDAAKFPFFWKAQLATAAAWSPDPKNPPLYLDLPIKDGKVQPEVIAKWEANSPLAFIDQYIDNLREYRAIALDVGDMDGLRFDMRKVHQILDNYGIKNSFEIYHGTHTSAVAMRFQFHVMPFFSKYLSFAPERK